jgi:competence protein ComEC
MLNDHWMAQRGHLFPWTPVLLAFGIGAYFLWPHEPGLWDYALAVAFGLAGLVAARRLPEAGAPLGVAMVLVALGFGVAGGQSHRVAAEVLTMRYYGPVQGRIDFIDRSQRDVLRLTLTEVVLNRVAPDRTPARVRIALHGDAAAFQPIPGQVVLVTAHLAPPAAPSEPGGFDFRRHAWFLGLGAVGYARTPVMVWQEAAGTGIDALRMRMSARIQAVLPGETGGFAAALATGDRSDMGQATVEAMRITNLAHIISISGLHMTIVAGFVFVAVRSGLALVPVLALRLPVRRIAALVAMAAAAFFLALSGGGVATERSFLMTTVVLAAILFDRRAFSLRAVALAGLVVLVARPDALSGPSFQMSFAATIALVGIFTQIADSDWRPPVPRWVAGAIMLVLSSLVAGLATAPFAAATFNVMSHYGLLANLLTVPLYGVLVMPAAVIAVLLMPLGLEAPPLWAMGLGLDWTLIVAHEIASWPGARSAIPAPPGIAPPLIALGGLWLLLWQGRLRAAGVLPILLALVLWQGVERPVLLIADDAGLVGVMTQEGRALSKGRGAGFAAESWLQKDGELPDQIGAAARWQMPEVAGLRLRHLTGTARVAAATCTSDEWLIVNAEPPAGLP